MTPNTMATGRGIETNGIGRVTTSHLNPSRTMAQVWADEAIEAERLVTKRLSRPRTRPYRPRACRQYAKIPYAGREEIVF